MAIYVNLSAATSSSISDLSKAKSVSVMRSGTWHEIRAVLHNNTGSATASIANMKIRYLLPETEAHIERMATPPSNEYAINLNDMIYDLKAGGYWDNIDGLYVLHDTVADTLKNVRQTTLDCTEQVAGTGYALSIDSSGIKCSASAYTGANSAVISCPATTGTSGVTNFTQSSSSFIAKRTDAAPYNSSSSLSGYSYELGMADISSGTVNAYSGEHYPASSYGDFNTAIARYTSAISTSSYTHGWTGYAQNDSLQYVIAGLTSYGQLRTPSGSMPAASNGNQYVGAAHEISYGQARFGNASLAVFLTKYFGAWCFGDRDLGLAISVRSVIDTFLSKQYGL